MIDGWTDRRVRIGVGWGLVVLALFMQAALFTRQSLWPDEIFSLAMATGHSLEHPAKAALPAQGDFVLDDLAHTAAQWIRYIQHDTPAASPARVVRAVLLSDTNPPFYYLLLSGWTRLLGPNDWTLRLFSVGWALACVPLITSIAARLGPPSMAVAAPVLFVFSPPACYYFAEGRMYSLVWFITLLTVYATLMIRERAGVWPHVLWVLASAAGLLTHYFFIFPWSAIVAYRLLSTGRGRGFVLPGMLAVGMMIFPWYRHLPESLGAWRITMNWLNLPPSGFHRMSAARDLLLQFFSGRTLSLWHTPRILELLAVTVIGTAAVITGLKLRWRAFAGPRLLVWLWLIAAWSGPIVIDAWRGTYTAGLARYAIAGLPAASLLIAGALGGVQPRWRAALLATIIGAWSVSLLSIYQWRWRSGAPTREVAREVSAKPEAGDLILVHSIPSAVIGLAYYMAPSAEIAGWVEQLGTLRVPESLQALIVGRKRVRYVRTHGIGEDAPEEIWLRQHAVVVKEGRINHTVLIDFRPRDADTF